MTDKSDVCPSCGTTLTFIYSSKFAPYAICSCGLVVCSLYDPLKDKTVLIQIGQKSDVCK